MKVGDLVRYLITGNIHLVWWTDGANFHLSGWGDFPFGSLTEIEVISEAR